MNCKSSIHVLVLILLTHVLVVGQDAQRMAKFVSKDYWLRHNLALGGEVRVTAENIDFASDKDPILHRNQKVIIERITDATPFAKVEFSTSDSRHEILVDSRTPQDFRRSFKLAFSSTPISKRLTEYKCEQDMKSRKDLFECYGYPISEPLRWTYDGAQYEEFTFSCWFLKYCGGWDLIHVKFKNGKFDGFAETH